MRVLLKLLSVIIPIITLFSFVHANHPGRAQPAAQTADKIFVREIDDDIKAGTALDISRSIRHAEAESAQLVIMINTAGGLLQSTERIVGSIIEADVDVTVFVHKDSGWAFSAGTIILMAADNAYAHPTATIGAAQPFSPEGGNGVAEEKALQATAQWIRSLADRSNRDADVAERFVTENLTLSGQEALDSGVIDSTARDLDMVLELIGAPEATVEELRPSVTGRIFNVLSHPSIVSLLLTLGGLALLVAIRSGDFEFSTAIGIVLLLVGFWGIGVIEFSWIGIGLLLVGVLLIMIEIFDEPGFGLFGAGGIIALLFGVLALSEEPFFSPGLTDAAFLVTLGTLAIGVIALGLLGRALRKSFKAGAATGPEALVGQTATVTTALVPRGRVKVGNESWQAVLSSGKKAAKNKKVRIIESVGNTLKVKLEEDE